MIKTITNSFSSSAILLFDEIRGIHSQFEDIEKMNLFGVIDYGFYWTEISLILVRDKTTIVVGKETFILFLIKSFAARLKSSQVFGTSKPKFSNISLR